ncbi:MULTISPECIES: Mov34/MPN/PAD-1 family protein [Flavobacterium]|uniref:Mov34/MPN/PAD-1 family protein n=1 Tax=Flavobacterium TaxID=237 RepID=UPI00118420E7|nr:MULTISPECIES: Mov34/MPN/PAD-1 family protein [Flavobacterium]MCR4030653.1 Mov34/MPN/PAD-1 family protein [Flavobacterium panacis]
MYRIKELGLTLDIDDDLISNLIDIGKKHCPNEFGGFLIGYYSESQNHLRITDTILPNKYKGTPYMFEREVIGVESKLKQFYTEDPKKYYIGEWHTHPNNLAIPSTVDIQAVKSIADNPEVSIKNPALLIIGCANNKIELGFYVYFKNKIYRYE